MLGNTGICGTEKVILSAKWWQEWCDYVNFESQFTTSYRLESKNYSFHSDYNSDKYNLITKNKPQDNSKLSHESIVYK